MIVRDNGAELTSNAILNWVDQTGVGWRSIAPGKAQQNGFFERTSTAGGATNC
jgi:putative transposase